jgi:hypothetical protein
MASRVVELIAQGIAASPEEARDRSVDDEWGRSESLDPDNVGDIADEGAGHRG